MPIIEDERADTARDILTRTRPHWLLAIGLCALGPALLFGQAIAELVPPLPPPAPNAPTPSLQAAADPGYAALIATCKTPPARAGGPGRAGGRGPAPVPGPRDYTITAIPGVIAARQRWTFVAGSRQQRRWMRRMIRHATPKNCARFCHAAASIDQSEVGLSFESWAR